MAEAQGSQETIKVFEVKIKFTDEGVQRVVRMTTDSIDKAKAAVASYDNTLEGFQATVQETSRAVGMGKGTGGNPSGLAAALTQELGRGISDAQFGMIGMANNMSQFATLAGALTAKTGGLGNAFKEFGKSLMGPNGVIVGINLVITLMPKIIELFNQADKAAEEMNETLKKTADAEEAGLLNIIDLYSARIKKAKEMGLGEEGINKLLEKQNEIRDQLINRKKDQNREDRTEIDNLVEKQKAAQQAVENAQRNVDKLTEEGSGPDVARALAGATAALGKAQTELIRIKAEAALEIADLNNDILKRETEITKLRIDQVGKIKEAEKSKTAARVAQVKHAEVLARKEGGAHQSIGRIIIEGNEQQKEALLDGTKNQAEAVKERIELMQKLFAAIAEFNSGVAKIEAEQTAKQLAEFQRKQDAIERFIEDMIFLMQGIDDLAQAQSSVINARADLEIEKERELMNAKMAGARTTQEKAKIEENYEKKVRAINERRIKDELKAELLSLKIKAATTLSEMAISQSGALVDLFKGKQKTAASAPHPVNIPLIAGYMLSAFATFKQMKAARMKAAAEIKSLAPGAGGPSGGGTGASFSPNFNLVGNTGANQLKDAIDNSLGEQNKEPVKAYVVLDELNAANDMKRQSESSSTL